MSSAGGDGLGGGAEALDVQAHPQAQYRVTDARYPLAIFPADEGSWSNHQHDADSVQTKWFFLPCPSEDVARLFESAKVQQRMFAFFMAVYSRLVGEAGASMAVPVLEWTICAVHDDPQTGQGDAATPDRSWALRVTLKGRWEHVGALLAGLCDDTGARNRLFGHALRDAQLFAEDRAPSVDEAADAVVA